MKYVSFLNTWFINISMEDLNKFFEENFQAKVRIENSFKLDNNFILKFKCKDITDGSIFSIYMGEFGFYDLKENQMQFNVFNENCDYYTQTLNLKKLLSQINEGEKINNKTYEEAFNAFHTEYLKNYEEHQSEL